MPLRLDTEVRNSGITNPTRKVIGEIYNDIMSNALRDHRRDIANGDVQRFDSFMGWDRREQARIRADEQYLLQCRMDAGDSVFFARQLEYIRQRILFVLYPEYTAQRVLSINSEAGPGPKTITQRMFDRVGKWAMVGENVKDIPRGDVTGTEEQWPIKTWAEAYGYTIEEIEHARFAGVPISSIKASAVRQGYEELLNELGWLADGTPQWGGTRGLIYHPNTNIIPAAGIIGAWCTAAGLPTATTPMQIAQDIAAIINFSRVGTNKVEIINRFLMPVVCLAFIKNTPLQAGSDTTIYKFVTENNPGVTFGDENLLANRIPPSNAALPVTHLAIAFNDSPAKVEYNIPLPYETLPVQYRGFEYLIIARAKIAGVLSSFPRSITIAEGVV